MELKSSYHADNGILHPNHGRIIAANATKECHTPESTPITKWTMSAAFGPSRTGPMLINSCASPMAVRNNSLYFAVGMQ
jgi:hypothetical protein